MTPAGGPDPRAVALPEELLVACLKAVDPLNGLIDWQPSVSYDGMTRDHIRDIARILGPHLAAASESRAADAVARAEAAERAPDEARILARRVLTWFDLGDERSTFPPALLADLREAAQVQP